MDKFDFAARKPDIISFMGTVLVRLSDYDALAAELAEYKADGSGVEFAQAAIIRSNIARIAALEAAVSEILKAYDGKLKAGASSWESMFAKLRTTLERDGGK